jgi:hypothetical protein
MLTSKHDHLFVLIIVLIIIMDKFILSPTQYTLYHCGVTHLRELALNRLKRDKILPYSL